jgi:hypothetical protein
MLLLMACGVDYAVGIHDQAETPRPEAEDTADTGSTDTGDTDTTDTGVAVPATAPIYGNTSEQLFEIDPDTGEKWLVGSFHDADGPVTYFVDIAIDMDGRLVGGTFDALYAIDPTDATVSRICDIDVEMMALAFTSDGRLFGGGDQTIREIDTQSCTAVELLSGGYTTSGDLVGLPDGYLYWTVRGEDGDELVRVDPTYGYTSWIGPIEGEKLFGLGYAEDTLYGFSALGEIVAIDPITAKTTLRSGDGTTWWGATTNPVTW